MNLLHIDSSILGHASVSRQLSAAIVARLTAENSRLVATTHDLAANPLNHLTLAHLSDASPEDRAVLDEFLAADIIVIGAPMYNFTVPSQLKAWIDRIVVAGETFRHGDNGFEGLAGTKRVIIAISRGNLYGPDSPVAALEHLETYLRQVFGFMGITPEFIVAEGIKLSPEARTAAVAASLKEIETLVA